MLMGFILANFVGERLNRQVHQRKLSLIVEVGLVQDHAIRPQFPEVVLPFQRKSVVGIKKSLTLCNS